MTSKIYSGKIVHTRFDPVRHGFSTSAGFMEIDLEDLEAIDRSVKGFGINRFSPVSLRESNYLSPGAGSVRDKLQSWIKDLQLPELPASIHLVTNPKWWGRAFNPVSFYLFRGKNDQLLGMVAEVNNTFGDRHLYPVRLEKQDGMEQAEQAKEFHVSPFNDMNGSYRFTVRAEGSELYIGVDLYRDGKKILESWMEGSGVPLTSRSLWRQYLRHPFRPWLTMPKIILQAAFLRFKHKLPVFKRPEPDHPRTLLSRRRPRV